MAADDAVIVSGIAPSDYAAELLKMAAEFRQRAPAAALLMAAPSALSARVQSVLAPAQTREGVTMKDVLKTASVALLAMGALVAACPSFAQDAAPAATPAPAAAPTDLPAPVAPPAPAAAAELPAPPAPPLAPGAASADLPAPRAGGVARLDPVRKIVSVREFRDAKGGHRRTVTVRLAQDDPGALGDPAAVGLAHAETAIGNRVVEIDRLAATAPKLDAQIARALADAQVQIKAIDDPNVRAKIAAALARAQTALANRRVRAHIVLSPDGTTASSGGPSRVAIDDRGPALHSSGSPHIRNAMRPHNKIEHALELVLFNSRWVLAPAYLGLVISLLMLLTAFVQELIHDLPHLLGMSTEEVILGVLSLIDLSLALNLVLIVVFSGYENFVSKIDTGNSEDRPHWMGTLDFSGLKMKLIGSIVAISAISLLRAFMTISPAGGWANLPPVDEARLKWMVILHLTFIVSGLLFAAMDWVASLTEKDGTHPPAAPES